MRSSGELDVDFRLLGPFEMALDEREIEIPSSKQRALLAMLVVHRNRAVPLETLAEELWGAHRPVSPAAAVQSLVYRLRRMLAATVDETGGDLVRASGSGYLLEVDPSRVDAHRFEELAARARKLLAGASVDEAGELFRHALSLWRGPALADLADREFARMEGSRLDMARLEVVEELAGAELVAGRPTAALTLLEPHVADHPLRENARGQLMVALYRLGRQAEALRAYQDLRGVLGEELGLEPNPSLRHLEQQILRQSPDLDPPSPTREAALPGEVATGPAPPRPMVRPPSDTFGFLFTDIEASTRRWEGDQDAMAVDLARHDQLLEEAVQAHRGHLFARTGDGLAAAFPTASAALAAAVAGQRTLLEQAWMAPAPLRVRMAVHAGTAEPRQGTYFGPTLNRTARLLEIASGGQILCSLAVADLAQDELPAGVTLLDLGEHRLADLTCPERIYQVAHRHLPSSFPPVGGPDAPRDNLPVPLTSFVGRESELHELEQLLATTRLLTLTGVGGAGKTRLALELAARVRARFPDGLWLVELGPLRDPSMIAPEVMTALGILVGGLGLENMAEKQLCDYLRSRCLLLVLDNCEHLVDPVARLVHAVLSRCPQVIVVVTSREVLALPGEVPWPVPALSLPQTHVPGADDLSGSDAVALFCARARTAQPGFALTDTNAGAIARICRRLDGIPLALELAAARIRVLGAHQLAERLDDRFRLLAGGVRSTVSRHQTLRAAMDWSYQLLPTQEQALLRRLSVFPQSFDLEAAETVAGEEAAQAGFEVLDLLARLVDKSLVVVDGAGESIRYRLLETVRQYGAERLGEAGETHGGSRSHRDFFLQLIERWRPGDFWAARWMRLVETDRENFQAALDWSLAEGDHRAAVIFGAGLWRYWDFAGRLGWACQHLERALAAPDPTPSWARLESTLALAMALVDAHHGDTRRARAVIEESLSLALDLDDREATARARFYLGHIALTSGHPEEGLQLLQQALAAFDQTESVLAAAWCHHEIGWAAMAAGEVGDAEMHFERCFVLEQQGGGDEVLRPHVLAALAPIAALADDANRSEALADEAIRIARGVPLRQVLVVALTRAADAAILSGNHSRARLILAELLGLLRDLGARRWVADALEATALVLEADDRLEAAARLLGTSGSLRRTLNESSTGPPTLVARVRASRDRIAERVGPEAVVTQESTGKVDTLQEVLNCALAELHALVEQA